MPATRDGKTWRSQFYYEDWQGICHKKNKRGFKTKAEAEEWDTLACPYSLFTNATSFSK